MIKLILKTIKSIFSDARSAIVSLVVFVLVGGTAGFLVWYETALNLVLEFLQTNTPVWATLIIVFCLVLYVQYVKFHKSNPSVAPKYENHLILYKGFKWLVTTKNGEFLSMSNDPYCPKHDSKLILSDGDQYLCPELLNTECKTKIIDSDVLVTFRNMARSYAESKFNKYETKH